MSLVFCSFIMCEFKMAVQKDACSSSARTPKLQLSTEQPSKGECWIPPKTDIPYPKAKEKPQEDSRRGKITFTIKPHTRQRRSEGSNKPSAHQGSETPENEPELRVSISCGGMGQQWPATGAGALGAADLGVAEVFIGRGLQ